MSGYPNASSFSQREFEIPVHDRPMGSPTYSQSDSQVSSNEIAYLQHMQSQTSRADSADSGKSRLTFNLSNMFHSKPKRPVEPKASHDKVEKVQKRRGPKPDSKPAQNRRQELNRAAQRTHRERKENYMKDLETSNQQLKDTVEQFSIEKLHLYEVKSRLAKALEDAENENRHLRQLLKDSNIGISHSRSGNSNQSSTILSSSSLSQYLSNGSLASLSIGSGGHGNATTSYQPTAMTYNPIDSTAIGGLPVLQDSHPTICIPTYTPADSSAAGVLVASTDSYATSPQTLAQADSSSVTATTTTSSTQEQSSLTFKDPSDDTFIAFVVDLEETCKDHAGYMMERLVDVNSEEISGHALMLTAPTMSHIHQYPGVYENKAPQMASADLNILLENSRYFNRNGEVTPIMALHMITSDERFPQLSPADFYQMQKSLKAKSRCYGFGAVLEDFEITDAMEEAYAKQMGPPQFTY